MILQQRDVVLRLLLIGTAFGGASAASAQSRQTYVELNGGVGYSTNPLLSLDDDTGSLFGRISASGVHARQSERAVTRLTAYVENTTYTNARQTNTQLFDLGAQTEYQTSETVRLFGNLNFSGDFGGQLATRFVSTPTAPVVPDPTLPPLTVGSPELFGLTGRQYRLGGQVGAAIRPTEREQWTFSANAQRFFFSGGRSDFDYWVYGGTAGYERQVSERASAGVRLTAQRSDFSNGEGTTVLNPQLTYRTRFSESWDAQLAVGATYANQDTRLGSSDSWALSFEGSLCRTQENSRFCARASRFSQNAATTDLLETTTAAIDYFLRVGERDTLQLSGTFNRYDGQIILGEERPSNYFTAAGTYSRRFGERLSAGVYVSARKLSQFGTDPKADVGGSVFISYRLGDIR